MSGTQHHDFTGSPGKVATRRRRRLGIFALVASLVASFGLVMPNVAFADVQTDAGFEGADGDLVSQSLTDWNDFDPVTWVTDPDKGAPYSDGTTEFEDWKFFGLTDDVKTNSDTAFSGGVKQDDFCASTKGGKAPNKDDLTRAYFASATVGGDVMLALGWVRIPQNSTSASAHIGFEFNQGETPCANGTGLVEREPGDALIVYDFEGGNNTPTLKISRWLEAGHATFDGTCEASGNPVVGTDEDGCWGNTDVLQPNEAQAKVNFEMSVDDELPPGGTETLNSVEFGEAIINLTEAGVFQPDQCLALGSVFAVSRSSGGSDKAQMKDLVGPGELNLTNCGTITVVKQTSPSGASDSFDFAATRDGGGDVGDPAVTTFQLSDASDTPQADEVKKIINVQPDNYTITETVPSGWQATNVVCTGASGTPTYLPATFSGNSTSSATFDVVAESDVVCTFSNQQLGSIIVEKVVAGTSTRIDGAVFVFDDDGDLETTGDQTTIPGVSGETGLFCIDGLTDFGTDAYTVYEKAAPTGYEAVTGSKTATAAVGDCASRTSGEAITADVTFENLKITSMTTVPVLYPNDSATLTGTYGTATGTITFKLYDDAAAACAGTVLFTQALTVNGDGPYSTTNYPGVSGITEYAITADGTYYWEVVYGGDSSNKGNTSTCTAENYVVNVTPDPTP